jgi:hypothetical protein
MPSTKGTKRNKKSLFTEILYTEHADSDDEILNRKSTQFMEFNQMVIPGKGNTLLTNSQREPL